MPLVLRIPNGTRLTWSELDGNFLFLSSSIIALSASFAAAAQTQGSILQNTIVSNQNVGGVSSGDTFTSGSTLESVLTAILVGYQPPALTSIALYNSADALVSTDTKEVGESFTVKTVGFSASADSPAGRYPVSTSFTSSGATISDVNYYFQNGEVSSTNLFTIGSIYTYTRTSYGSISYIVNGAAYGTNTPLPGVSISILFAFKNYLAASATLVTNNTSAQTVINTGIVDDVLTGSLAWTATCTSANQDVTKYTYIIYPSSYADITSIKQNGSQDVTGAFTKLSGTYNITNLQGVGVVVKIYRSNQPGAFINGTLLEIL